MTGARIYTALRLERAALLSGLVATDTKPAVGLVGMGGRRARRCAVAASSGADSAITRAAQATLVTGLAGGLGPDVRPGDVVVASEVFGGDMLTGVMVAGDMLTGDVLAGEDGGRARVTVPSAPLLAGALRRLGLRVHIGPMVSVPRPVRGAGYGRLAATGALAVDMESAWLALISAAAGAPFAAVRVVVDTARHPLWSAGTVARGVRGLRTLRRTAPALARWMAAIGPRQVCLVDPASPVEAARGCDRIVVLGWGQPARSGRPDEIATRTGVPARHVYDVADVDLAWLSGASRIAVLAARPGAPGGAVDGLLRCLAGLGQVTLVRPDAGVVEAVS